MMEPYTQEEREFFERVIMLVNNIPRYEFINMSEVEFTNYLKRKFRKNDLNLISRYMLLGKTPEDIVYHFKLKDLDGFEIAKEYSKIFKGKNYLISYQKKIVNRYCDMLIYNKRKNKLIAFEIKSNGDTMNNAVAQINDYSKWADEVYLIIDDRKKYEKITKEKISFSFGVVIYNQKRNKFNKIKKSDLIKKEFNNTKFLFAKKQLNQLNEKNWKSNLCK